MDNTLDYLDQVHFLSHRALGHGPVVQLIWVYDRPVDLEALRRFQRDLGQGTLGRRVAPSPLPVGRHRWLAWPGPVELTVDSGTRSRPELGAWADEQGALPIDPEHTPWRLAVQPLAEGGAAVSLVVSHNIADGIGLLNAVADAVNGVTADRGLPAVDPRTRGRALREDARDFLASLPELARAVAQIPRSLRDVPNWGQRSPARRIGRGDAGQPRLHSVTAYLDGTTWDERADNLGGTANSLFLGFVARLAVALGWADADGSVNLVVPVSVRADGGDARGNALNGVSLGVDARAVTSGLQQVRAGLKAALTELGDTPNVFGGPLALTPLVPKFLARRVEVTAQQHRIISCSNLGTVDPAVNRPDGTDADRFALRTFWNRLDCRGKPIQRSGGVLFPVETGRVHDTMFITVCYASADPAFTRGRLGELVGHALADFHLTADIE